MRILVNATTCVVGGGAQVATSFVRRSAEDSEHKFRYAVSPLVRRNLGELADKLPLRELTPSPAKPYSGRITRRKLRQMEDDFGPDVVFTVFGPAYVRFQATHVCGFADPWVTHRSAIAWNQLSPSNKVNNAVHVFYKKLHLNSKDYYWTETEVAHSGLAAAAGVGAERVKVIPNCYSDVFDTWESRKPTADREPSRILTLSAPYRHKNLVIIPKVARELKDRRKTDLARFVVTLPQSGPDVSRFWRLTAELDVAEQIENVGQVPLSDCPRLYDQAAVVFMPTLLETFSVSYLEAMRMKVPIVTTDLDFARDTCGNAAEYYNPLLPTAAADALLRVIEDKTHRRRLVKNGCAQLRKFPTPEEKYKAHIEWLVEVARQNDENVR